MDLDTDRTALQQVIQAGASVAKEVEARRASSRLDSAATRVDIRERLALRTLERASRYLGTRPVATPDNADFLIEIHMERFGIDARSNNATYLFTKAEAVLIDRKTGREIWHEDVDGRDRMTPWVLGSASVPSAIFTAATLHAVSVADFERALDQLVTFTSNLITDELREDLRDARER
jgi:alkylated DNA repair dioxygenase AlkB